MTVIHWRVIELVTELVSSALVGVCFPWLALGIFLRFQATF